MPTITLYISEKERKILEALKTAGCIDSYSQLFQESIKMKSLEFRKMRSEVISELEDQLEKLKMQINDLENQECASMIALNELQSQYAMRTKLKISRDKNIAWIESRMKDKKIRCLLGHLKPEEIIDLFEKEKIKIDLKNFVQ